jgi:uncharacterized protein (TIGR02246 family)
MAGCRLSGGEGVPSPESLAAAEDSIRALAARFIAADSRRDAGAVLALFADDAGAAIASNGALRPSLAAFGEALDALYGQTRELVIVEDGVRVTALGPDAAVLTATYESFRTDTAGKVVPGRAALTYVGERRGGSWKIVHYHFSRAPAPGS